MKKDDSLFIIPFYHLTCHFLSQSGLTNHCMSP
jgi:hypothetical protein